MDEFLVGLLVYIHSFFATPKIVPQVSGVSIAPASDLPEIKQSVEPSASSAVKLQKKRAVKEVQKNTITVEAVVKALNEYRSRNGAGPLAIEKKLQEYAQSRADYLNSLGKLDKHSGHEAFMNNGGFDKLGFNAVAENQSWNYKGSAEGLISEFYAKSFGHNKNQLNPEYTHVGIGIKGVFTNLVFGGRKI